MNDISKMKLDSSIMIIMTFVSVTSIAQVSIGRYKIMPGANSCAGDSLLTELNINEDKTFSYKYVKPFAYTATYYGRWKSEGDTLILSDTIIGLRPVLSVKGFQPRRDSLIIIVAKSKDGNPVEGVQVSYEYLSKKMQKVLGRTDIDGKFKLDAKSEFFEYIGKDTSSDAYFVFTFSKRINDKMIGNSVSFGRALSADIELLIDAEAKDEPVERTTFFMINNRSLIYLSHHNSMSNTIKGFSLTCNFVLQLYRAR